MRYKRLSRQRERNTTPSSRQHRSQEYAHHGNDTSATAQRTIYICSNGIDNGGVVYMWLSFSVSLQTIVVVECGVCNLNRDRNFVLFRTTSVGLLVL